MSEEKKLSIKIDKNEKKILGKSKDIKTEEKSQKSAKAMNVPKKSDKSKKVGEIDMIKAREIVLDTIGREEKPAKKPEKNKTQAGPTPLFFKRKKFDKLDPKKIIVSKKGAEEVKEITKENKQIQDDTKPLFLRHEKKSDKNIINLKKKAEGVKEIKEATNTEDVNSRVDEKKTPNPLFFKKGKELKSKKIKKQQEIDKSKISELNKEITKPKPISLKLNKKQPKTNKKIKDAYRGPMLKGIQKQKKELFSPEFLRLIVDATLYVIIFLVLILIIFYSCFVILVTQFNFDNKTTRTLSRYLPIPAIITDKGIIEYYDYNDALRGNNDNLTSWIKEMNASKAWKLVK